MTASASPTTGAARSVGARVLRSEDLRILTGRGRYLDDIVLPGMLHAAFLHSPVAHGVLRSIGVSEARQLPGVVAVYTGADLATMLQPAQAGAAIGMTMAPGLRSPRFYPLATDRVRYVGDPIALVIAENRYVAEDALELIVEDIEPMTPVVTYDDALDPSKPALFDDIGENIAMTSELALGDVDGAFAKAAHVIRTRVSVHRHQPVPMECRGIIASWDPEQEFLTLHWSTQSPHMARILLPIQIGVPMERIRVLADDVGGGFGLKNSVSREDVAIIAASKALGRPVKWVEDRLEHLATGGQAREEMADVEAAVEADGRILAVKLDIKLNAGAYPSDPFPGAFFASAVSGMFQGPLKLEGLAAKHTSVFSNKATYVSYRGPWATADFVRERLIDVVAHELGLEPIDVRRSNYVVRGQAPHTMLTGRPFTSVTTSEQLDKMAVIMDLPALRAEQAALRAQGRYVGIGIASYIEGAPGPKTPGMEGMDPLGDETTYVSVDDDGTIVVVTRQQPHGQGHETTLAQVASDELGVRFEDVRVVFGDTDLTPIALIGTGGSRAATMANGAVLHASRELRTKILSLAAELLEANPDDLTIADGVISVRGTPQVQLALRELAVRVAAEGAALPEEVDTDLKVTYTFDGGNSGWSGGTHCAIVEVDPETGLVEIQRYVVIEDCGEVVNPAIVEGQVRGGVAQGIGAVLLEHSAYGDDGQFLAGTFMDYLMPTTTVVPNLEIHHVDTVPSDPDVNFRGVGEGGMIVAPACLTNAIEDALAPFGVRVTDQHLPPSKILTMIGKVAEA